ncbi:MAG: membrane protein insertase YidC, partial [Gemmatimonadota bacterium]
TIPGRTGETIPGQTARGTPERGDGARDRRPEEALAPGGEPEGGQVAGPAEDTVIVTSPLFTLRFSTRGATLVGASLHRYESYAPNGENGRPVELIRPGDRLFEYGIAVGSDTLILADRSFEASVMKLELEDEGSIDSLVFRYRVPTSGPEVVFAVTHTFDARRYLVRTTGRLEGFEGRGYSLLISLGHGLKTNEANPAEDLREAQYVVNGRSGGIRATRLDEIDPGETRAAGGGPFTWVSVKSKYFLVALLAPAGGPGFGGLLASGTPEEHSAGLVASLPVPAGSPGFEYGAYLGPLDYARLEAIGNDLQNVNPYGWRWLQWLIRPLVAIVMWVLTWLHDALALAYGWVLILFGILMRVVLFPLYQKSMRSQIEQMQIQPLVKDLQARYKEDPQRLQQEMIKLYKEHGVNPLSGCLPMMLPMPVLFTLFFVFRGTIEFRGEPFLWLPDLSLKDPIYVIPLVMGASMYLLQWIGQRGIEANPQMKVMTYVLPVVFTVLFLNFPSGLNLYYATSNIASLPQQWYLSRERRAALRKRPAKASPKAASSSTTASGPP